MMKIKMINYFIPSICLLHILPGSSVLVEPSQVLPIPKNPIPSQFGELLPQGQPNSIVPSPLIQLF